MGDRKSTTNKTNANINSQIFAPGFIKNYRLDNIQPPIKINKFKLKKKVNSLNKAKVFLNCVKFFYMHCILR